MSSEKMKPCLIFPFKELTEPDAIKECIQAAEQIGFEGAVLLDHVVLGEEPAGNNGYTIEVPFQEPLVLFSYMAALTEKIKLITGVLVAPQRQTALLAKQSADLARLSKGRLILGLGIGNNEPEFEAMGMDYHGRAQRLEDQIEVMRWLWRGEAVTITIGNEKFTAAGINPGCAPIDTWIGGFCENTLKRAAEIGDGYIPLGGPVEFGPSVLKLREYLKERSRKPETFPVMGAFPRTVRYDKSLGWGKIESVIRQWQDIGISHLAFGTQGSGLGSYPDKHIDVMAEYMNVYKSVVK